MIIEKIKIPRFDLTNDEERQQWEAWCEKYRVTPTYSNKRGFVAGEQFSIGAEADYLAVVDGTVAGVLFEGEEVSVKENKPDFAALEKEYERLDEVQRAIKDWRDENKDRMNGVDRRRLEAALESIYSGYADIYAVLP